MSDEKKKIECRLKATGTDRANEKVVKDLAVPDPEPKDGKRVLGELMEEESRDDTESENSE